MSAGDVKIFPVKLTSYGELHPGRERSEQLDKRCWNLIQGSTLYGAISKFFIDFCPVEGSTFSYCNPDKAEQPGCKNCPYRQMLTYIKDSKFKISPLIPVMKQVNEINAEVYCSAWHEWKKEMSFYKTTHSPINRESSTAHEGRIYNIERHPSVLEYIGFILVPSDDSNLTEELKKAISSLSFNPFGGKGKFAFVDGMTFDPVETSEFLKGLTPLKPMEIITPVVHGGTDNCSYNEVSNNIDKYTLGSSYGTDLTLMRIWRKGLYPEEKDGEIKFDEPEEVGSESRPLSCIPEGGIFEFNTDKINKDKIDEYFLRGIGNSCYTYLGYGQVVYI